jgi:hypothetical protein
MCTLLIASSLEVAVPCCFYCVSILPLGLVLLVWYRPKMNIFHLATFLAQKTADDQGSVAVRIKHTKNHLGGGGCSKRQYYWMRNKEQYLHTLSKGHRFWVGLLADIQYTVQFHPC